MTDQDRILAGSQDGTNAAATTLHLLFRFLRTVRFRKGILVASLVMSTILGMTYYITAERIYESTASLYVVRKGSGVTSDATSNSANPVTEMPTYIALMSEEEVIARALRIMPEKYRRVDLAGYPQSAWVRMVRDNLQASSAYNTNVMDISYRSRDPRAAAAMLTAMLAGYEQFLNETNRGLSEQGLKTLATRLEAIEQEVKELQSRRLHLKASAPELVDTGERNQNSLNTISKNIEMLTQEYTNSRRRTEEARTTSQELQRAIASGEDILQFAMETLDSAGRQLVEQSMGLGTQDSYHVQRIMQEILDRQSALTEARQKYGAKHARIRALETELAVKEKYLREFPELQRTRTDTMTREVLAPRLVQYLSQQILKLELNEKAVGERLAAEQAKAQKLSQTLTELGDLDRQIEHLYEQQKSLQSQSDGIGLNKDTFLSTKVSSRPTVPIRPVSPRLPIAVLLSLLIGTGTGLAVIWVLDIMDDRFRTPEELKLHLETQVLSMIPRMTELPGEGFEAVMCHVRPHSREVEPFRAAAYQHRIFSAGHQPSGDNQHGTGRRQDHGIHESFRGLCSVRQADAGH